MDDLTEAARARTKTVHDDLHTEYYTLVEIVTGFDQRLLTIKGWGVTFSLATAALGFQQNHYGLFLVAAAASVAFWVLEGSVKTHQMRYYPRMRDIEAASYELYRKELPDGPVSAPLIDWSWSTGRARIRGGRRVGDPRIPMRWPDVRDRPGLSPFLYPHVAFPHAIVLVLGTTFFVLGLAGRLGPI